MRMILLAAMTGCLGMGVTACSSDSDDSENRVVTVDGKTFVPDSLLTEEERYLAAAANTIGSIVRNLTGVDDVTLDQLAGQTFEPTYGQTIDGEASTVRATKAISTEYAEQIFRSMTGMDDEAAKRLLTATPDGYELSLRDLPVLEGGKLLTLGTLTFHRDGGSPRYGYVEVDIPCIPHLERIDYLSAEAFPDNDNVPYQPGDVVLVDHDVTGYCGGYYLCVATNGYKSTLVHLCIGEPGGDETCNFDNDKQGCWVPYNGREKNDKTSYDDILDYISFLASNQAKVATIKAFMRGEALDAKPSRQNRLGDILPEGFNNDAGVVFVNSWGDHDGGNIYYDAYFGKYHPGYAYDYRHSMYAHIPHNCTSSSQVECKEYKYVADSDWKPGHQYYTMNVIHARSAITGATLEMSATKSIEFGVDPMSATTQHLGWCYADDGVLYDSVEKARKLKHSPVGFLAFVNTGQELWMDDASEMYSGYGHGLVVSYKTALSKYDKVRMNPTDKPYFDEDCGFDHFILKNQKNMKAAIEDFGGLTRTQELAKKGSPAAKKAVEMKPATPLDTSGWFIPTTGQWLAMMCGYSSACGQTWPSETDDVGKVFKNAGSNYTNYIRQVDATYNGESVFTSSAFDEYSCIRFDIGSTSKFTFNKRWYGLSTQIRPVFAF